MRNNFTACWKSPTDVSATNLAKSLFNPVLTIADTLAIISS